MQWNKKDLIFAPKSDFYWMVTHAALPIADHVEGDRFRVYFTGRDDQNRSRGGYLEIDINAPNEILSLSEEPVLEPGPLGAFDDSGAMPSWVVNHDNKKYLYYTGWMKGVTVPFYFYIGLAVSSDGGKTFTKHSEGPILGRDQTDPYLTASPSILNEDGKWRMWYVSCIKWEQENGDPKHYYLVKYAESDDGLNWDRKDKICIDFESRDEYAISRPCVIKENDVYKMWYSYRGDLYRIGYAESEDGLEWVRKDEEAGIGISESGWDSDMICYPFVFNHKDRTYMLYNGNDYGKTGFGYAVLSEDR